MVRNRKPSAEYSVIIPQHGCWEKTVSCCSSLLRHHACALELLVVDDGSNEWDRARSRRYLRDMAWCIEQPRSGVTAAWNRGLSLASAPVRVLLNNDVETLASWLPELDRILHAEPRALVGAEYARSSATRRLGRIVRLPNEARMLAGWCLGFTRSAAADVGDFDEGMCLYWSDTDWQLRWLKTHGSQIGLRLLPENCMRHRGHVSTRRLPTRQQQWQQDREHFLRKWGGPRMGEQGQE